MGWMAVVVRFLRYGRNDDGEFNPPSRPRGTRLTGKEGGPLAPGVVMLRADIRPWSRAAIYPPSVPPEGGKQDRLRAWALCSGWGVPRPHPYAIGTPRGTTRSCAGRGRWSPCVTVWSGPPGLLWQVGGASTKSVNAEEGPPTRTEYWPSCDHHVCAFGTHSVEKM